MKKTRLLTAGLFCALLTLVGPSTRAGEPVIQEPYRLDTGLESRTISFENPTGGRGAAGMTASKLGSGRKGAPSIDFKAGETVTLCDIAGPGTLRHLWITTQQEPEMLRAIVIRGYWEGQAHPSIECPLGDFMGFAHGKVMPYASAAHSVGQSAGMNLWLPMPFTRHARFTLSNEGSKTVMLFYYLDCTLKDKHPKDVGRLHVSFRRENPTTLKRDFVLLPPRQGSGRFIGSVLGIRSLDTTGWWGEGEVKVYLDGDKEFPTICGTGSEDYVGLSWGIQQTPFPYQGCSLNQKDFVSMYRWHLPDPIYWHKECRITIQQIGYKDSGLYERQDDWSCAAFWYERIPSAPLPPLPTVSQRVQNVWTEPPAKK